MSEGRGRSDAAVTTGTMEIVVALLFFVAGAVVSWDSWRLGAAWGMDGPEAGYFPLRIGLLICLSATVVLVQSLRRHRAARETFVERGQLRDVLSILIPAIVYVLGIQLAGIYLASAVYIALFMALLGGYGWPRSAMVGIGVALFAFVLFEFWFRIPLPKGFVERARGF